MDQVMRKFGNPEFSAKLKAYEEAAGYC